MVLKKLIVPLLCLVCLSACSDDSTSTYSKREYVYCYFSVLQYTELFHVMGNPGQFASIRKHVTNGVTKVTMSSTGTTTDYTLDALSKNFGFGLGGLIMGTNYHGEPLCYDLACPICDRADRRLSITTDGYAKCGKCGVTYDLNNNGVIYEKPEDADLINPRGLYRYRIRFDGTTVNAYN